jgi:hypothetical protein
MKLTKHELLEECHQVHMLVAASFAANMCGGVVEAPPSDLALPGHTALAQLLGSRVQLLANPAAGSRLLACSQSHGQNTVSMADRAAPGLEPGSQPREGVSSAEQRSAPGLVPARGLA